MKQKFIVWFLLLITISGLTLIAPHSSYAQTENLKILNYSYYMDMLGNIVVVGEVQNTGKSVIDYVLVSGTISGSDGSHVEAGNRAWGSNLLPGQKAPFYLDFIAQYTNSFTWYGVGIIDIALNVNIAPITTQYQYQDVNVVNDKGAPTASGEYWVNGELKNIGSQTANTVSVIATFYNSSGIVVATGYTNPVATLSAGATTNFKVAAFDSNQTIVSANEKIAGYSLLVQVKSPMQEGVAPTVNPTVIPGLTMSPTSTPTNTQTNTSNQYIIYLVAILAAVMAISAVAIHLRRRKPSNKSSSVKQSIKNKN